MPDPDDALIETFLAGRREPFVRRFRPLIAWVVRRAAGEAREDLVQEAFVALLEGDGRRLRQYRPGMGCRAASWVGLVARQTALKALERERGRREVRLVRAEAIEAPEPGPDTEPLRRALDALPDREALCLRLLVQQGMGAPDVARVLGVERQTVYAIRDRAMERLRGLL